MGKTKERTQHELTITQQPPPTFANQHRGKKHGFVVVVKVPIQCVSSSILKVELLYADDFSRVPDNSNKRHQPRRILQVLEPVPDFNAAGEARILVRINDVSRNHRCRLFCLGLSTINQGITTASVRTTPIKVISKMPKRNRSEASTLKSPNTRKRCCTEVTNNAVALSGDDWKKRAFNVLTSLENRVIGHDPSHNKITQCPSCLVLGRQEHAKNCALAALLEDFKKLPISRESECESGCTLSCEDERHDVSYDGCEQQCEASCLLPSTQVDCDAEDERHDVSSDDLYGCEEQCEASCRLPLTQVDCDAEEASLFNDYKVVDFDELFALIDPISLLD